MAYQESEDAAKVFRGLVEYDRCCRGTDELQGKRNV